MCMIVCYGAVCISVCACSHTVECVCVHTSVYVCAHTSVCAQVGWQGARAFLLTTLLPCASAAQVLKWRRACTVIRFQWGHRRIRSGKSRDMSTGHLAARANSCQELHLLSFPCHHVGYLGCCKIRSHRR